MSILVPSTPVAGTPPRVPGKVGAVTLEVLLARLVAQQASGLVGYWAAFHDHHRGFHFAFTTDPTYADLSPENAASRARAVVALGRAIERNRAMLERDRALTPLLMDGGG